MQFYSLRGADDQRITLVLVCASYDIWIQLTKSLKKTYSSLIKTEAKRLGFLSCGISKADFLEEEAPRLENWLKENRHGSMSYMENHFDKRLDPRLLVDGAKSVVSLLYNYYPDRLQNPDSYKISKYAYGTDYHFVIKDKLKALLAFIRDEIGEVGPEKPSLSIDADSREQDVNREQTYIEWNVLNAIKLYIYIVLFGMKHSWF